jgi:hypothetical protein
MVPIIESPVWFNWLIIKSFYIRKFYRCSNHTLPIRCLFGWKEKLFPSTKTDIVYLVQTDNIIGVIKLRAFIKVNYRCLPFKVDNDLIQRNINLFDIKELFFSTKQTSDWQGMIWTAIKFSYIKRLYDESIKSYRWFYNWNHLSSFL